MKKRIFKFLLVLFALFIGVNKVEASVNDFTVEVKAETGYAGGGLEINIKGTFEENASYYAKFVSEGDQKPSDFPDNWYEDVDDGRDDIAKWKTILPEGKIIISNDWYLFEGYDWVYFLKCNKDECVISDNPVKVEKPTLPELGQRYHIFFFSEKKELSVIPYFPYSGENGLHKMNVKIGMINDNNLLYSIYKKEQGSLNKLMDYAKNNDGKTISFDDDKATYLSFSDLEVVNGAYYYIYTTYENSDGMYRDLSDIAIAMGEYDHIVNDVKWNFTEDDTPSTNVDNKEKNPSTSDTNVALIIGGLTLCIGLVTLSKKRICKSK